MGHTPSNQFIFTFCAQDLIHWFVKTFCNNLVWQVSHHPTLKFSNPYCTHLYSSNVQKCHHHLESDTSQTFRWVIPPNIHMHVKFRKFIIELCAQYLIHCCVNTFCRELVWHISHQPSLEISYSSKVQKCHHHKKDESQNLWWIILLQWRELYILYYCGYRFLCWVQKVYMDRYGQCLMQWYRSY